MMSWRFPTLGTILLILAPILGCESGTTEMATVKVSGTVKLDGKPVSKGTISFESQEDTAKGLGSSSGEIKDGKYEFQARPGPKTVQISAPQEYGKPDETGVKPTKETIPARFNEKSTLKKTITTEGPNTFDFDLKSK